MAQLTEAEKAALAAIDANLNDEEKQLLNQFKEHFDGDGEGDGDGASGDSESQDDGDQGTGDEGQTASESEGEGAGDEGAGEEDEGAEQQPSTLRIGDREVPVAEVQALLEFQQWASENPDKMRAFGQFINGEAEFVVRAQQQAAAQEQARQEAEQEIDWDTVDPAFKRAWEAQQEQMQQLQERIEQTQGPIQAWQQQQMAEATRQAGEQIQKAAQQVKDKFSLDLNEKELDELFAETAKLQILPGLRNSIADPTEAVATALELTIFKTPRFRDKIVQSQVTAERAKDKRHLAGIVGGNAGSERGGLQSPAGEVDVRRMSPEERRKAMAAEIGEAMRGTP